MKKISKFLNSHSAICEKCYSNIVVKNLLVNKNHIYPIGQLWECNCGHSKIWTNSLRDPKLFLKSISTGENYRAGICNDKFCGKCFKFLYPLKNGYSVPWTDQRFDLYGCKSCDNQNIIMDIRKEWKENETGEILNWYKNKIPEIQSFIKKSNHINFIIKLSENKEVVETLSEDIQGYIKHVRNNEIPPDFKQIKTKDGFYCIYFPNSNIFISGPGINYNEVKKNALLRLKFILAWIIQS